MEPSPEQNIHLQHDVENTGTVIFMQFSCSAYKDWVLLEKGLFQFYCENVSRISELKKMPAILTQHHSPTVNLKKL